MHERIANRSETRRERRKATRFPVVIPVEAKWLGTSGKTVKQTGQAKEANASGGLLDMKTYPSSGSEIELTNVLSGETLRARVVGPRRYKKGETFCVAVAFLIPSETFWGVNFQLKKTSAELVKIEQAIRSGGIAQSILTEFRDAVDHVRRTAWAVQEWQERQLLNRDPQTVLPLITTERIRRATQLSKAIAMDLAEQEVTSETAGMDEFFQAVGSLHQQVADLFKDREP